MKYMSSRVLFFMIAFLSQAVSFAQSPTNEELVKILQNEVAKVSSSVTFSMGDPKKSEQENIQIARDNYSFTLEGKGTFIGIPDVEFLAYFNKNGQPNYFRALLPDAKTAGNLNLDALADGPDWKKLFLPTFFTERIMLSSWVAEFDTDQRKVSKLALKFRIAGNLTPIEGWDITMKEIAVGYEIENPLSPKKEVSGILSATMNVFGAEANISSNLVTDIDKWKISSDNYGIKIPLKTMWEKINGDKIMPWPSFLNEFEISKLQVDIYPTNKLEITAWTNPLGNFNFVIKRSKKEKEVEQPLSSMLTGGYKPKTTPGNANSLNTQLTGGYSNTGSSSSGNASSMSTMLTGSYSGTSTGNTTKTTEHVFEILAAYSLPENLEFGGPLTILNSFKPTNAGIVVSTMDDTVSTSLPVFAGLGSGNTSVRRGVTFLAYVDIENFREKNLKNILKNITKYTGVTNPLSSILFRANLPLPPEQFSDFSASAQLNFTKDMNFFNHVFIRSIGLTAKPASGDPEFGLNGTVDVVLDNPQKPLRFKGEFSVLPSSLTMVGKGQMEGVLSLPRIYGFPKVSISNLALTAGIKFSTDIPTPDNMFLSGQMLVNNIAGNLTIGLDQNDFGKNMMVARFCNLDFNSLFSAFCSPEINAKIPGFVRKKIGGTGIKNVYLKFIPIGAKTNFIGGPPPDPGFTDNCYPIPTVRDNDFSPGFKLAGQAEILNWDGNFVAGFEGDMTGLSAGFTMIGNMAPLKAPFKIGKIPVFELTGSGGRGRPELFIDLSTRHLISGITNKFSAVRTENSTDFVPQKPCFLQARHSGRVFDIKGSSKAREADLQQKDLNRSASQEFVFEPVADGYYSIRNVNSGMYLDVHMGLAQPGRKIWQYNGNKSPAQLFKPVMNKDGYFELESKLRPDLVVEVADEAITNGTILQINTRNKGAYNQEFRQLLSNLAPDPSTESGYRENQVVYGSGQITVLGVTANAYIDLNTNGFECNLNGDILGFLKGSIQVTIADFGKIVTDLKGVSVSGSVDQKVVQVIQDKTRDVVKAAFGKRMANVFSSISSKFLDIRSITFSGNLDAMKSSVHMKVTFAVAGKVQDVDVDVDANVDNIAAFAEKAGKEIARFAVNSYNQLMDEAEKALKAIKEEAEKAVGKLKDGADAALNLAQNTTTKALNEANNLKNKLGDGAKSTFNATSNGFKSAGDKTEKFFRDFGKYTKETVEKIFHKSINQLDNGWNSFTSTMKKAFTGGDNEERIMTDGPAFRIITKDGNVLASPPTTKKKFAVLVKPRGRLNEEIWQLIPNDRSEEGSFFLVSGYNALLISKQNDDYLNLIPHESDHKDRERMLMESVPGEPGWYYLKYRDTDKKNGVVYTVYAEVKSVMVNNVRTLGLFPGLYNGNNKPGNNGKFRFEKAADIEWKRVKNLPPYMVAAKPLEEGGRYQFNGEPEQYIYSKGTFRWIPDLETLNAAGFGRRALEVLPNNQQVSTVLGKPYPSLKDGSVIQAENDPAVYIIEGGKRRHIPDWATLNQIGVTPNMIQSVLKEDLNFIPQGEPIPSQFKPEVVLQEKVLYQVSGNPTVYIVINKTLRPVPDPPTLQYMGYNFSMVQQITAQDLKKLPIGAILPTRKDGALVSIAGRPAVYIMEYGVRRAIPDMQTFNSMNLSTGNIQQVSAQDVNDIPEGQAIPSVK